MTKKKTQATKEPSETNPEAASTKVEETPFEAAASICSVLVVGLFILTFLAQNFVIPSGSMENTLLVGDHLVVDRITLAPPPSGCHWFTTVSRSAATSSSLSSPLPSRNWMLTASLNTSSWSNG